VAVRGWLYAVPIVPVGSEVVVITGGMPTIIIVNAFVSLPPLLVAFTVKLNVPAAVGFPEITPAPLIVKPFGNVPLSSVHVTGAVPVAVRVWLYAVPIVPFGSEDVVITGGMPTIIIVNAFVSLPPLLVAFTVKLNVPVAEGFPEITPAVERVKPPGNEPLSSVHVTGAVPVAVRVWLYAVPIVPFGSEVVVITGGTPLIIIVSAFVLLPALLDAFTVKLNVPAAVGFPEITPAPLIVKPFGNVPLSSVHVTGVEPVAVRVWLYAVPIVPFGSEDVVITGGTPTMVIDNAFVSLPPPFVAFTVKLNVPVAEGVPEITPAVERVKPVGNEPLSRVHVIGVEPVAVRVWLYAVPSTPPGKVVVVIAGGTCMVIDKVLLSIPPIPTTETLQL
jgi:hypothetical protein